MISDQCGNQTTVEQTLVFQDIQPPYWLNEPDEIIITNDIENDEFDLPVADDICSPFEVQHVDLIWPQEIVPFPQS